MNGPVHAFHAVAFVENLSLKELSAAYPEARRRPYELWYPVAPRGSAFLYPFGAMVFHNVDAAGRQAELARLHRAKPGLTNQVVDEEFVVREVEGARPDVENGVLTVDTLTAERASVVAITVAQSAAMEYYDALVDQMFVRTDKVVDRLEKDGTVPYRIKRLHQFIGQTVGARNEVLSVLHLLDKPDAIWDDPGADRIFEELRAEFDLADRYQALELKLRSVQEAMELVLGVARDRRLVFLEAAIVVLILFDIVMRALPGF